MGHTRGSVFVFADLEGLRSLVKPENPKNGIFVVAQTTFEVKKWQECVKFLKKVYTNPQIFDTICKATVVRQEEAARLSAQADAMVVIGGAHSSNTRKLYSICSANCPTVLVQEAEELPQHQGLFSQASFIGITAGASTPVCIIKEVQETMSRMDNISNDMTFEEMLEQSFKSTYNGEKVTGIVTGIKPNEIFVDIGTKHAGFVPMSELTDDPSAKPEDIVKVGDEIELLVVRVNDVEGTVMCSKKRLDQAAGFEKVMNEIGRAHV